MLKPTVRLLPALLAVLAIPCGNAGEPFKSGPQLGSPVHEVTALVFLWDGFGGEDYVGKHVDLISQHGRGPCILVFAREINDPLTRLIKQLDAEAAKTKRPNGVPRMRNLVVFLSDHRKIGDALQKLGKKEEMKSSVLAVPLSGKPPKEYRIAMEAEVTVILFVGLRVKANHAFKKGELDKKAIDAILADVPTILPAKKEGRGPSPGAAGAQSRSVPLSPATREQLQGR
jgi:hypothetical protein